MGVVIVLFVELVFLIGAYQGRFRSEFVSAVVSATLVLVTTVSVILNAFLLEEQQDSKRKEVEPVFQVVLTPTGIGNVAPAIENIGNGPAINITGTIDLPDVSEKLDFSRYNISQGDKAVLPVPEEYNMSIDSWKERENISIDIRYQDIFSNKKSVQPDYDVNILLEDLISHHSESDNSTEQSLESIENTLGKIERAISNM
ncbi:hypothetical protein [Natronococcus jeotgali]|uniref:hypothetical protein n=1 Tax=Natronococcus jeotgali TaxID=413812 RepID=UPI0012687AD3|nr:hypothetical protein [Natronococcus jeotgali]